jgi:methylmalonyl-CoA mutase cobalamin-binding domain/chain
MTLAPLVVDELHKRGVDIPVVVGGIIPEQDIAQLTERGIAGVLTPGSSGDEVVAIMRQVIDAHRTESRS